MTTRRRPLEGEQLAAPLPRRKQTARARSRGRGNGSPSRLVPLGRRHGPRRSRRPSPQRQPRGKTCSATASTSLRWKSACERAYPSRASHSFFPSATSFPPATCLLTSSAAKEMPRLFSWPGSCPHSGLVFVRERASVPTHTRACTAEREMQRASRFLVPPRDTRAS